MGQEECPLVSTEIASSLKYDSESKTSTSFSSLSLYIFSFSTLPLPTFLLLDSPLYYNISQHSFLN